jgi:hypothetical protein
LFSFAVLFHESFVYGDNGDCLAMLPHRLVGLPEVMRMHFNDQERQLRDGLLADKTEYKKFVASVKQTMNHTLFLFPIPVLQIICGFVF